MVRALIYLYSVLFVWLMMAFCTFYVVVGCVVCVPVVGLAFSWPPWLIAHGGVIVLLSPPDHIVILAHVSIGVSINIRGVGSHKFSRRIHFGGGGGRSGGGRRFVFTGRG